MTAVGHSFLVATRLEDADETRIPADATRDRCASCNAIVVVLPIALAVVKADSAKWGRPTKIICWPCSQHETMRLMAPTEEMLAEQRDALMGKGN